MEMLRFIGIVISSWCIRYQIEDGKKGSEAWPTVFKYEYVNRSSDG